MNICTFISNSYRLTERGIPPQRQAVLVMGHFFRPYGLSNMSMDEISAEVKAVRNKAANS